MHNTALWYPCDFSPLTKSKEFIFLILLLLKTFAKAKKGVAPHRKRLRCHDESVRTLNVKKGIKGGIESAFGSTMKFLNFTIIWIEGLYFMECNYDEVIFWIKCWPEHGSEGRIWRKSRIRLKAVECRKMLIFCQNRLADPCLGRYLTRKETENNLILTI